MLIEKKFSGFDVWWSDSHSYKPLGEEVQESYSYKPLREEIQGSNLVGCMNF